MDPGFSSSRGKKPTPKRLFKSPAADLYHTLTSRVKNCLLIVVHCYPEDNTLIYEKFFKHKKHSVKFSKGLCRGSISI